ncbi:hypothetical protein [Acaryochloris sp. IP29b_bin.148]|uniref:hypothetical protein n=1 Tax=Acaryochloris sp. IP29b_bin.148 TaxID=2969218 RepID=UPI002612DB8C|nr:hypothetical protein [Acaryochloris sp. IP29b_bin.148]
MSAPENCDDPWQTPSSDIDAELLKTSQRLMEKSDEQFPQPAPPPHPELEMARQKITELELQRQKIFQRNVSLTAEVAQLRATNQHLTQELAVYRQQPPPKSGWFRRFFRR